MLKPRVGKNREIEKDRKGEQREREGERQRVNRKEGERTG